MLAEGPRPRRGDRRAATTRASAIGQELLASVRAGWLEAMRTDVGVERKLAPSIDLTLDGTLASGRDDASTSTSTAGGSSRGRAARDDRRRGTARHAAARRLPPAPRRVADRRQAALQRERHADRGDPRLGRAEAVADRAGRLRPCVGDREVVGGAGNALHPRARRRLGRERGDGPRPPCACATSSRTSARSR